MWARTGWGGGGVPGGKAAAAQLWVRLRHTLGLAGRGALPGEGGPGQVLLRSGFCCGTQHMCCEMRLSPEECKVSPSIHTQERNNKAADRSPVSP